MARSSDLTSAGELVVGVVSDTHGQLAATRQAVVMLEALEVDVVLHCGDIGSPDVVQMFAPWPTHFVLGNVDLDQPDLLRAAIDPSRHQLHGRFGQVWLARRRIALVHGDDARALRDAVTCGEFDVVCHGHTHVSRMDYEGDTLVLNPGAVWRARPRSIAVLRLPEFEIATVPL